WVCRPLCEPGCSKHVQVVGITGQVQPTASFCESKLARRYSNLKLVSVETLRRVMDAVTRAVERSIAAELPERFGLVFDGWSHDSEHFIAVFACVFLLKIYLLDDSLLASKVGVSFHLA
ncbi:hypothetical protein JG688_00008029, partial [Phytophthora aleatoria]